MIEIGIDSQVLQKIRDGRKTIEGRLARDKFIAIKTGDVISVREDFYERGTIINSQEDALRIKVNKVQKFSNFHAMLHAVDFKKAIPDAATVEEAINEYVRFYSEESQKEHGVVAISFHVLSS